MAFKRILVTTDFSKSAGVALGVAKDLAERCEAELTAIYVQERTVSFADGVLPHKGHRAPRDVTPQLRARLEEEAALHGVVPDQIAILTDASPTEGILKYAADHNIDLIVIATRGHSAFERLLIGSVTERVVRHAKCAVLTVKL